MSSVIGRLETLQLTTWHSAAMVSREAVQASAEQLKSLREKRWDTIGILALPSVASLSGT
jgi:hypothetical protein